MAQALTELVKNRLANNQKHVFGARKLANCLSLPQIFYFGSDLVALKPPPNALFPLQVLYSPFIFSNGGIKDKICRNQGMDRRAQAPHRW